MKESMQRKMESEMVRNFVLQRQREAYEWIGDRLALGSDPQAVFARLSRPPMPRPGDEAYADLPLSEEERIRFREGADASYDRFFADIEPPTPLEDPNRYANLMLSYELERDEPIEEGAEPMPEPALATLPLGDPSAWISPIPGSGRPAIFFDYALFDYLYDFSKVMGLVLPNLPLYRMDDREIASLGGGRSLRFQVSMVGSSALVATTLAWAVTSRTGEPSPVPDPGVNRLLSAGMLHFMQRFVVAHELAHIRLGHLESPAEDAEACYAREFEADREGADRVCRGDSRTAGSWGFRRWTVDGALGAFALFDQALRYLAHGGQRVAWISSSHPDFLTRRDRLRAESQEAAPSEVELDSYRALCRLGDSVLAQLAPLVKGSLLSARKGGQRPSQLWDQRLESSMSVVPAEGG